MNAIELLKQDHRTVRELFKSHAATGDSAMTEKRTIADTIFKEFDVHTQIEEEMFYPAARGAGTEQTEKLLAEAYEEHKVAKNLIVALRATSVASEEWDAKMKVLCESVDHHIEEEQNELFPEVEKALDNSYMRELGEKLEARKQELSGTAPSMGGKLVKMVTRAYDSLTGNGESATRAKTRKNAAKRSASTKTRSTKKTPSKSPAKASKRGATKARRVASSAKTSTIMRARTGARKVKARVSAARTRVAKVLKGARKTTDKRRRSVRR